MYSYETVGKGACIIRMSAVGNYSTNTIMKQWKKETGVVGGGGGGLRKYNFKGYLINGK